MPNPNRASNLAVILQDVFEKEPYAPGVWQGSQRLTKGKHGKRIVLFPSVKTGYMMPCESRLEADSCLDLEFDESVADYRTQPFSIPIRGGSSYTPDSVQRLRSGEIVVREVKFTGELRNPDLNTKLRWLHRHFHDNGATFCVTTEESLQLKPLLQNRKRIYRASHCPVTPRAVDCGVELLHERAAAVTLGNFRTVCSTEHLPVLMPEILLLNRLAVYEEDQPLTEHSLIWVERERT